MQLSKDQIRLLASRITETIFVDNADRVELKKKHGNTETSHGGWGKLPFEAKVKEVLSNFLEAEGAA